MRCRCCWSMGHSFTRQKQGVGFAQRSSTAPSASQWKFNPMMQGLNSCTRDTETCGMRQSSYSLVLNSSVEFLWRVIGSDKATETWIAPCKTSMLQIKFQEFCYSFAQRKWTRQQEALRKNVTAKVTTLFPHPNADLRQRCPGVRCCLMGAQVLGKACVS